MAARRGLRVLGWLLVANAGTLLGAAAFTPAHEVTRRLVLICGLVTA